MSAENKPRFIITSGPTREYFDPVRFLSNPSTGRMGYAIARACINQGYNVTYICGPVNSSYQQVRGAENIRIVSTIDMLNAVKEAVTENCVLIMAAAPADYRPEVKWEKKLKKEDDPAIHLVPNPDILKSIAAMKDNKRWHDCILIGFAAETHDTEAYARKKLVV